MGNYRLSEVPPYTPLFPDQGAIGCHCWFRPPARTNQNNHRKQPYTLLTHYHPMVAICAYEFALQTPAVSLRLFTGEGLAERGGGVLASFSPSSSGNLHCTLRPL